MKGHGDPHLRHRRHLRQDLTGAMIPYAFGSSDGSFNLGSAIS